MSDLNWVCEESWIPAFSQVGFCESESPMTSIFSPSSLSALFLACSSLAGSGEQSKENSVKLSILSDHYGRIPAILSSNLVALVSGIAIPFVTEYVAFCLLR